MFEELYNTESGKYEYVNYRSQDFFLNDNSDYINFKDKAGSLNIFESKSNVLECNSNNKYHFRKKIIGIRRSKNKKLNGLCYKISDNYLYNFNRVMIEYLLNKRVNDFELPDNYKEYTDPLEQQYSGEYKQLFKNKDIEEVKNRNQKLNNGKLQKIKISSDLYSDLENNFDNVCDYLSRKYKKLPNLIDSFATLYILQLINKECEKDYSKRSDLTKIEQKDFIKVNDIWNKYQIPENYSFSEFVKLIQKIKEFNNTIIQKTGLNLFVDQVAWNYIEHLYFDCSDELLMKKLEKFNELKNSTWASLDKLAAVRTNTIILTTKAKEEYLKLKKLLDLNEQKEILYDTIKKEYIIPIKFKEPIFGNTIEYLNNLINKFKLEVNCADLYRNTTVANINNKTVKVISTDTFIAKKTPKKKVISKQYSNYILDHLANPFKFEKPQICSNIILPFYVPMEIKENPFHLGYTKFKLDLREDLEISAIEKEDVAPSDLCGIDFINFQNNKYLGKIITKQYNLINKINQRLQKNGKSKLQKSIPNALIYDIIGNFIKASLDISVYKYNNIESDRYEKRSKQTYYIASTVRAKIIQESIKRFVTAFDVSKFGSKENFLNKIKALTRYDTALAIYKSISEDIFKLNKTEFDGSYSRADICLSYDLDLNKITNILSNFINVKKFFIKKTKKDSATEEIKGISLREIKSLVRNASQISYTNGDPSTQVKTLAIRHFFAIYISLIFKIKKEIETWIETTKNLIQKQFDLKDSLLKIPLQT